MKVDIAGLKIDSITKPELLQQISDRLKANQKTFIITPYSEFLYHSLRDPSLLEIFNRSDFAVPDGIGIFWAHRFLSIPLTAKSYYGKILQAFWHMVYSGAAILLNPRFIRDGRKENDRYLVRPINGHAILGEKISGSELIWDLAQLAAEQSKSIFLLGGFGNTPKIVADKLTTYCLQTYNVQLTIAGYSCKAPNDPSVIQDIKQSNADFLFVAYGPIKQEQWILEHKDELPCQLLIGLGGTFDYIAGKRKSPPGFIRSIGLEWLWRLITQPYRMRRIFNAVPGLIMSLIKYKVFMAYPYRKNVVSVILDRQNRVLICQRNPTLKHPTNKYFGYTRTLLQNYWQFPQGGWEENEDIVEVAKRECQEELHISGDLLELIEISSHFHAYVWKNACRPLLGNTYHFKGQTQNIVYLKFHGTDSDIRLDQYENIGFKWVSPENLASAVHPDRRPVAEIIQRDLPNLVKTP